MQARRAPSQRAGGAAARSARRGGQRFDIITRRPAGRGQTLSHARRSERASAKLTRHAHAPQATTDTR